MTPPLNVHRPTDGVVVVEIDDAPYNRIGLECSDALSAAVDDIASDDTVRAWVLTGSGEVNFSVGMNLKELGAGVERAGGMDAFFDSRLDLVRRIETMGKPSVATLFGYCLGAGLELPLGCTFRLAADAGARIGLPELELGSVPAWGGSARLAKLVGEAHALDLILRSKKIDGDEALRIGLVHEVWPLAELKRRAIDLATHLASQPRLAVRMMLDGLRDARTRSLEDLLAAERAAVHATAGTADAAEGILAFLEKRTPRFNRTVD